MSDWETLGAVDPRKLADTRLQIHAAAQAAAAVGKQLLPPQPDFSEQSFVWIEAGRALAQGVVSGLHHFRAGLRFDAPTLLLLDGDDRVLRELRLAGHTLDDAYGWLAAEVEGLLGRPLAKPLERPDEPAAPGGPLSPDPAAAAELGRWFAGADRLLQTVREQNTEASPVRCWPHHFDLATLLQLDPGSGPESARTIGAGLSPGGDSRDEPYFYVTPWPYPQASALPELDDGGAWNTDGWVGAVLEGSRIVTASNQADQIARFLDSAVAACRRLLAR